MAEKKNMSVKEFGEHMLKFNTYGLSLVNLVLGHDMGLLDKLGDMKRPVTAGELADSNEGKSGLGRERITCLLYEVLNCRYVHEWLGGMTAAQIVKMEGEDKYYIPDEHFRVVKTNAILGQTTIQGVQAFSKIKNYFSKDGKWGGGFDEDFWDYFIEFRALTGTPMFKRQIIPKIEDVPELMKKLDIYPRAVNVFVENARKAAVRNVDFKVGDAQALPDDLGNTFDLVMAFDTLHDFTDVEAVLRGLDKAKT